MDIVTQGLLGGLVAQSVARPDEKKLATLAGMVAGLVADADILIRSSMDPLLAIEYHRHFSHSLLFIPAGAALALILLWPFMRQQISLKRLYLFCLGGYSLSGVLDACTSYGTHLLWPFSDQRVAWHLISIVDPLFSAILFVALWLGLRRRSSTFAYAGLTLAVVYLGLGFLQQQRATDEALALAQSRGHQAQRLVVKPTLGNLLLWRSVYIHQQRIYVDAIRVGVWDENKVFEGDTVAQFTLASDIPGLERHSTLYKDVQRFVLFSDDYVAWDPSQANILGDIRYSMLPNSPLPLWGIEVDRESPQLHANYRFFRDMSVESRGRFISMLLD